MRDKSSLQDLRAVQITFFKRETTAFDKIGLLKKAPHLKKKMQFDLVDQQVLRCSITRFRFLTPPHITPPILLRPPILLILAWWLSLKSVRVDVGNGDQSYQLPLILG